MKDSKNDEKELKSLPFNQKSQKPSKNPYVLAISKIEHQYREKNNLTDTMPFRYLIMCEIRGFLHNFKPWMWFRD